MCLVPKCLEIFALVPKCLMAPVPKCLGQFGTKVDPELKYASSVAIVLRNVHVNPLYIRYSNFQWNESAWKTIDQSCI